LSYGKKDLLSSPEWCNGHRLRDSVCAASPIGLIILALTGSDVVLVFTGRYSAFVVMLHTQPGFGAELVIEGLVK
jgi:hypothetical protein